MLVKNEKCLNRFSGSTCMCDIWLNEVSSNWIMSRAIFLLPNFVHALSGMCVVWHKTHTWTWISYNFRSWNTHLANKLGFFLYNNVVRKHLHIKKKPPSAWKVLQPGKMSLPFPNWWFNNVSPKSWLTHKLWKTLLDEFCHAAASWWTFVTGGSITLTQPVKMPPKKNQHESVLRQNPAHAVRAMDAKDISDCILKCWFSEVWQITNLACTLSQMLLDLLQVFEIYFQYLVWFSGEWFIQ